MQRKINFNFKYKFQSDYESKSTMTTLWLIWSLRNQTRHWKRCHQTKKKLQRRTSQRFRIHTWFEWTHGNRKCCEKIYKKAIRSSKNHKGMFSFGWSEYLDILHPTIHLRRNMSFNNTNEERKYCPLRLFIQIILNIRLFNWFDEPRSLNGSSKLQSRSNKQYNRIHQ